MNVSYSIRLILNESLYQLICAQHVACNNTGTLWPHEANRANVLANIYFTDREINDALFGLW